MFARQTQARPEDDPLPASKVGRTLTVKGVLDTEGELYVHGYVCGRINAYRLILGSLGSVEGDVVATDVLIGGRLTGRIFAPNVTLEDSANITGKVFHTTATVAKGARVDGRMPWRPTSYFETLEQLPEAR
jgi:cytoskeletal protein CcmA (bactofilin family)